MDPGGAPPHSTAAIEKALGIALRDPGAQDAPSDAMASFLMTWQGGSADALRQLLATAPTGLARAKGFLNLEGQTMLLNWSINHFQLEELDFSAEQAALCGKIVFILRQEAEAAIMAHLKSGGHLTPLSVQRPMGIMAAMQSS